MQPEQCAEKLIWDVFENTKETLNSTCGQARILLARKRMQLGRNKIAIAHTAAGVGLAAATGGLAAPGLATAFLGVAMKRMWRKGRSLWESRRLQKFKDGDSSKDVVNGVRFWLQKNNISDISDSTRIVLRCWDSFQRRNAFRSCQDAVDATDAMYRAGLLTLKHLSESFQLCKSLHAWIISEIKKNEVTFSPATMQQCLTQAEKNYRNSNHSDCKSMGKCFQDRSWSTLLNDAMNENIRGKTMAHLPNKDFNKEVNDFLTSYSIPTPSFGPTNSKLARGAVKTVVVTSAVFAKSAMTDRNGLNPDIDVASSSAEFAKLGFHAGGGLVLGVTRVIADAINVRKEHRVFEQQCKKTLRDGFDAEALVQAMRTLLKQGGYLEKAVDYLNKLHSIRERFETQSKSITTCSDAHAVAVLAFRADKYFKLVTPILPPFQKFVEMVSNVESLSSDNEFDSLQEFHASEIVEWMKVHPSRPCSGICYWNSSS